MYSILAAILVCCMFFQESVARHPRHRNQPKSTPSLQKNKKQEKPKPKRQMLQGAIRVHGDEDYVPELRVYFDGMETFSNKEGFYSFPIEEKINDEYSLIICRGLDCRFKKHNTLDNLRLRGGERYKSFSLKRTSTEPGAEWERKERTLDDCNFVIPENSIVVLVDPKYVDHVQTCNVTLPEHFVGLPSVVLKKGMSKKLKRTSAKSLLYSLELKPFHERIWEEKKLIPKGKGYCSLVK